VRIVDTDQEGGLEGLAFEERLEVSEQPEPLFRLSSRAGKLAPIDQRFGPFEQCREESGELHDALARLGDGGADPEPEAASDVGDLGEQSTLPHPSAALQEDDRSGPLGDPCEFALDERELRFAPVEVSSSRRRHHCLSEHTELVSEPGIDAHQRPLSNHGFV
jgi:hypothetical protein